MSFLPFFDKKHVAQKPQDTAELLDAEYNAMKQAIELITLLRKISGEIEKWKKKASGPNMIISQEAYSEIMKLYEQGGTVYARLQMLGLGNIGASISHQLNEFGNEMDSFKKKGHWR